VLPDIVQNEFYLTHGPRGKYEGPQWYNISTSASMGKVFKNLLWGLEPVAKVIGFSLNFVL
jgi:hypothetical protein